MHQIKKTSLRRKKKQTDKNKKDMINMYRAH